MLASVTNNPHPPGHWLNTVRESSPTATSLSHRVIAAYMENCKGLLTSVLSTEATWSLEAWSESTSSPLPEFSSHSGKNPMWPHSLAYRHLSLSFYTAVLFALSETSQ